jgi:hypothetical protein
MLGQIIIGRSKRIPSILSSSETISQRQQKAVKHIIATIFSAQDALRDLAPEQRWAGMGISSETTENTLLCPITISRKLQEGQMATMLSQLMV